MKYQSSRWLRISIPAVRVVIAIVCLTLIRATPASGWSFGRNRVQTPAEDGLARVGYGPGWVLVSYMPNCPGVGYLFSEGILGKN